MAIEKLTTEQADNRMLEELLKHVMHVGSYFFPFRSHPVWGKLLCEFTFQDGKLVCFKIDNEHTHKV